MRENLELGVIGALMDNNQFHHEAGLTSDYFKNPIAKDIWDIATKQINSGNPVDAVTLMDLVPPHSIDYLVKSTAEHFSGTLARQYAKKLKDESIRDKVKSIAEKMSDNPDEYNSYIAELLAIEQSKSNYEYTIKQTVSNAMKHIDDVANGKINSVSTGLKRLDETLGGFHKQDLVILAARPAMGKTSLVLNMLSKCKARAGIFSAEMGNIQIGERLLCIESGVSGQQLRQGKCNDVDYGNLLGASTKISDMSVWINDKPAPSLGELVRQARQWKLEKNVEIIFIDYLQRLKLTGNDSRHEKVGEAARTLKELARDLDIPIVVLAQVNRQADGIRPNMSHLAQSGEIEAEADQILFLYRDEVYNKQSNDKGIAEIIIGKNRHGGTGGVRCQWDAQTMRFNNLASEGNYL